MLLLSNFFIPGFFSRVFGLSVSDFVLVFVSVLFLILFSLPVSFSVPISDFIFFPVFPRVYELLSDSVLVSGSFSALLRLFTLPGSYDIFSRLFSEFSLLSLYFSNLDFVFRLFPVFFSITSPVLLLSYEFP